MRQDNRELSLSKLIVMVDESDISVGELENGRNEGF